MNTDSKAILRVLAAATMPYGILTLHEVCTGCAIGRMYGQLRLSQLQESGLVECESYGWRLTLKGRNHVETRMA